jgi:hypothetical protein
MSTARAAFLVLVLSSAAAVAQQAPSPAQMGMAQGVPPATAPATLSVLDYGTPRTWAPMGTVDPVAHTFTPLSGGGGGGATYGALMPTTGTPIGWWDGTNFVRPRGDETNGVWVNIKAGGGSFTWPGTAALTNYGTAPTGTVPAVNASVTSGGFAPAAIGTPIAVTTGGVTGTLPTGAIVVATNVGSTNGAYCNLGASATTAAQYISPGGGWFAFQVGAATQLTCLTSAGTTTVNMVGGAGLPNGTGGGGSGGVSSVIDTTGSGNLDNEVKAPLATGTNVIGYTSADVCAQGVSKQAAAFSITSATTQSLVSATGSKKIYICSISMIAGSADNVNFYDVASAGACSSAATDAVIGAVSNTAANGLNFAANGGLTLGSGAGVVALTPTVNSTLCVVTSSSGPLAGNLTYVQQ